MLLTIDGANLCNDVPHTLGITGIKSLFGQYVYHGVS